MNQKSIEHIVLYFLVLVGTLVVGVLVRQFVLSKGVDDFSSNVTFFATVIVLMAIYASLQTTFNQFLLPRIEAFLLRFFAFQTMKNHNDTVSAPEALTIEDSNQATPSVIVPAPTAEEMTSEPSNANQFYRKKESCYSNQIGKGPQLYEANNGRLYE